MEQKSISGPHGLVMESKNDQLVAEEKEILRFYN